MKITAPPRSDQLNADDFLAGSATFTIAGVREGKAEQRYDIELVETPGRAWRPPLTVLRLLMAAWGDDSRVWVGRRVTLYRDPAVKFGGDALGGIRVSHMSDLPGGKKFSVKVTVKRGQRGVITVEPLPDATHAPKSTQQAPTADDVAACHDVVALREMWKAADDEVKALIQVRVDELNTEGAPVDEVQA